MHALTVNNFVSAKWPLTVSLSFTVPGDLLGEDLVPTAHYTLDDDDDMKPSYAVARIPVKSAELPPKGRHHDSVTSFDPKLVLECGNACVFSLCDKNVTETSIRQLHCTPYRLPTHNEDRSTR
jgi:hypothetical protein